MQVGMCAFVGGHVPGRLFLSRRSSCLIRDVLTNEALKGCGGHPSREAAHGCAEQSCATHRLTNGELMRVDISLQADNSDIGLVGANQETGAK